MEKMIMDFTINAKKQASSEAKKAEALLASGIGYASGVLGQKQTIELIKKTLSEFNTRRLLTYDDLAKIFGISKDWVIRNHKKLTEEHGFPAPLAGFPQARWDNVAVDAWFDAQMPKNLKD